jgi:hypothetical protein
LPWKFTSNPKPGDVYRGLDIKIVAALANNGDIITKTSVPVLSNPVRPRLLKIPMHQYCSRAMACSQHHGPFGQ